MGSSTVRLNVVETEPPLLFAQTVNIVVVRLTRAMPYTCPLINRTPEGNAGSMAHDATAPPELLMDTLARSPNRTSSRSSIDVNSARGSTDVILRKARAKPPELVAFTVNIVVGNEVVGTPDTVPLSKVSPAGKAGSIVQTATEPPDRTGVASNASALRVTVKLAGS